MERACTLWECTQPDWHCNVRWRGERGSLEGEYVIDSTAGVEGSVLWGRVLMFIEGERETGGTASISFYQPVTIA